MAIDTQGIASIGENLQFDPAGAQGKALSIKDMMDREQMNKLQLGQAKQDAATNTKVQELLKGENIDYSSPEGVMRTQEKINKISPAAAMKFGMEAQKYSSGKVQAQVDQYELLDHQQGVIVSAIDPIVAEARAMKNKGASDMEVNALIAQRLPSSIQQLQQTKLPNGESALSPAVVQQINAATQQGPMTLAVLEGFEAKSKQGQAQIRQRLEQLKGDTQAKNAAEKERHDEVMESQGQQRVDITQKKIIDAHKTFGGENGDLMAALAERGISLPAGFRSKDQQVALLESLRKRNPGMDSDAIADKVRTGQIDLSAVKKEVQVAAGQVGKVELATNELKTFGDQVLDASKAVPRGHFVPWTRLKQMLDSSISDPNLLTLKVKLQALNNAYDQLAARGGTDTEKRAHIAKLFNSANSPETVAALVKAVKDEAAGAEKAAKETMRVPGSAELKDQSGDVTPPRRPGQETSGAPAPFADPAKEARYQAWKAAHPNG